MVSRKKKAKERRLAEKQQARQALSPLMANPPEGLDLRDVDALSPEQRMALLPGGRKMSELLLEYVQPFLEISRDEEDVRRAVYRGVQCWNIAVLPPEEARQAREEVAAEMRRKDPSGAEEMLALVEKMVQRQHQMFPGVRHIISDHVVWHDKKGIRLSVTSIPPPEARAGDELEEEV